jgi:hypothetical protein
MPKEKQKKYTIQELKEAVKFFRENHPDIYKEEWYDVVRDMESNSAEKFINFLETGEYK